MSHFWQLLIAARRGRRAVRAARTAGYYTELDALTRSATGRLCHRPAHADVRPLRALWRLSTANRRPDQEPVFLAAALLAHGRDAALTIGRETAPPSRQARYQLWVSVDGETASTGQPVTELCTPLATFPSGADVTTDGE